MNEPIEGWTRRAVLRGAGIAALGAAAGCAGLMRASDHATAHPCDAHLCRYWRPAVAPGSRLRTPGQCALSLRVEGGEP